MMLSEGRDAEPLQHILQRNEQITTRAQEGAIVADGKSNRITDRCDRATSRAKTYLATTTAKAEEIARGNLRVAYREQSHLPHCRYCRCCNFATALVPRATILLHREGKHPVNDML